MPVPTRSLATLPLGVTAVVRAVHTSRAVARRLMEMGLVPGTAVRITRVAPLGDPLELHLRNYALSVRRTEALSIEIDEPLT